MIPLYHDFSDETVLVFGGGAVGARKARRFAREAEVVVVGPEFAENDYGGAQKVRAAPSPDEVDAWFDRTDPALAIAATDDEAVNEAIETSAQEDGVLVNRADHAGSRGVRSVVVPATVRDGTVTVSISTDGTSPALSKEIRRRVAAEIEDAGELADITADIRSELKANDLSPETRRDAVRAVVQSPSVWKDLGTGRSNPRRTADAVVESVLGDHE